MGQLLMVTPGLLAIQIEVRSLPHAKGGNTAPNLRCESGIEVLGGVSDVFLQRGLGIVPSPKVG